MAWRQFFSLNRRFPTPIPSNAAVSPFAGFSSFSSKSNQYIVKVGIPEFLNGVGKGVETHAEKIESEIGDFQKLLVTRTLRLKRLGIPVKHRKLILKYTHKYRLGLWRPRAEPVKS
nr:T-cell immunoglobulin and mucin domain-containing protein [Ipomoea batatas]GMD48358.1 T-cell immunoglobulin and mucin domain-containing protein [Ipomoea batatas]